MNNGKIQNHGSSDRVLVSALIGVGVCVPALLTASQFMPLNLLEAFGVLTGGGLVGSGIASLISHAKPSTSDQSSKNDSVERPKLRPVSELVLRHTENGDVSEHSGTNHAELGQLADAVLGKGLLNLIRISDRPTYLKAVSDAQHGRTTNAVHLNIAIRQAPRIYQEFAFSARPTLDGCVSSLRDISAELELKRSLQNAPTAAETEDHLAKVASHMAHELRSPLNSILGFSEMLAGEVVSRFTEDQRKEYAGLIHQSGTHMLGVIDNMLDIGQLKAGRLELSQNLFDVGLLCHESVSILEPQTRESALEIDIDCPHDLPPLYADEKCCRQMLINLLGNAIKFTSGAGQVSLTARQVKGHIEFEVKDSGIGIPDEALARMGQPFERVEGTNVPGTGLGLSLVRQMVGLHGGTFRLESVLGEGTTATLSLPIVRAAVGETFSEWTREDTGQVEISSTDSSNTQRRIA